MTPIDVQRDKRSVPAPALAEPDIGTIMVWGHRKGGREVLRRLTGAGARPLALVRSGRGAQLIEEGIGQVTADLDHPDTIDAALDGVDRLFLLTRQTSRQLAQEAAVIAAAARAGIGRVVKLSVFRADETSRCRSPVSTGRRSASCRTPGSSTPCCGRCSSCRTCSRWCVTARSPPPLATGGSR